jgi:hypothetical protein
MTMAQRLSQVFGWAFVVVGVAGFAASGMSMDADPATAPRLLGVFPVNVVHNIVHIVFGLWGVLGSRSFGGAKSYLYGAGVIYLVLAALGYVVPSGFGLVPIGGSDVGLHLFLGLALLLSAFATARGGARTVA